MEIKRNKDRGGGKKQKVIKFFVNHGNNYISFLFLLTMITNGANPILDLGNDILNISKFL